jgi:type IX secretion system PorP/SprF family membrane protein
MNKLIKTLLLLVLTPAIIQAQDIHFSQFYNSPLTLNPTLTGYMNGNFRLGAIYRNQWREVTKPFVTTSGSFDLPIRKGFGDNDVMGVGAVFFHDQSGTVNLATVSVNVSFAYHKVLGINKTHVLSIGIQGGYMQKKVDLSNAVFADQMDGSLTPVNPSADAPNIQNVSSEQLNIGLSYAVKAGSRANIFIGGSLFNLTKPKQSFFNGNDSRLPMRIVGHSSVEIKVSDKVSLIPSIIYMNQAKTYEVNVGFAMNYEFAKDVSFLLGGYYRGGIDAAEPMIGLSIKGFQVAASYDVNISPLKASSNYKGAFEVSLLFVNKKKDLPRENSIFFCPRF